MATEFRVIDVTDDRGGVAEPVWLARAEAVHRQLRHQLPADYLGKMRRIFADGGRMTVATDADRVVGVAVYRVFEDTFNGVKCYVDDLVTDERERSRWIGHAMIESLADKARAAGCSGLSLDSGTQRTRAHGFYFREGFVIPSFHFFKQLQ